MRTTSEIAVCAFWVVTFFLTVPTLVGQVDVLTQHNDNARTGANLQETALNPSNVNAAHFGKLAFRLVDGNLYAQPLVVTQAKITGRTGNVNAVIVATEHNSVYAFDADDTNQASTTAKLWQTAPGLLGAPIDAATLYKAIGAPGCVDLTTEVGITGTPAIKITNSTAPKEGVIFVAAKSMNGTQFVYNLFALNLADGTKLATVAITGAVKGAGIGSNNGTIAFNPEFELNRPGLLLVGNVLYIAFGGHCDQGPYHGWVFAYDVSNPQAPKKIDVYCSTPNGTGGKAEGRAGIWMSGQGPAADDAGNVYFVTGDGTNNATTDLGDSIVKVGPATTKITVQDWYAPQDQATLKVDDVDLGSSGAVVVPNSHLVISGSKEGRMYLVDRNQMGKGVASSLQSFQVTHAPDLRTNPGVYYNIHGTPIIWQRSGEMFVYVTGEEDPVKQYRLIPDAVSGWKFESATPFRNSLDCAAKPNCVSAPYPNFPQGFFGQQGREPVWMPGGFLSLSANGGADGSGILWVTMPFGSNSNHAVVRGVLRALDASDVSKPELWDSENTGNVNDRLGQFAKFCPPTVANGKVYVATFQQETIGNDGIHRKLQGGDQPALAIYGPR